MRFFIIPKRMFKNNTEDTNAKRRLLKNKKLIIITSVSAVVLIALGFVLFRIFHVPSVSYCEEFGEFCLEASEKEDREKFFEQFSFEARQVAEQEIVIPCDSVQFERYNKLQKSQGLDLMPYCGKKVKMYTMKISKEKSEESQLYGVLLVYKGKVIGAHITDFKYPALVRPVTD